MTLWLIVGLIALWALARAFSSEKAAEKIRKTKKQIYQARPRPKVVRVDDYRHLDQSFYVSLTDTLRAEGFVALADIDLGSPLGGARPIAIRMLVSDDGRIMASGYHFRAKGFMALLVPSMRNLRVVDFESELDDGSFVVTTNAWATRHTTNPAPVLVKYFESDTPLLELYETHRRRVDARSTGASRACVAIRTLDEALHSQERLRVIKAGFERDRDHTVDRDELTLMARDVNVADAHGVANEIADEMKPKNERK